MLSFILPETATAPPAARRRYAWRSTILSGLIASGLLAMIYQIAPAGVLLGGVVMVLILGSYEFIVLLRSLDELQQRLHILALAISGGVIASVVTLIGLMDLVDLFDRGLLSGPRIALALPAFFLSYYLSLLILVRRYA